VDVPDKEIFFFQNNMPSLKSNVSSQNFMPGHLPQILPIQQGPLNSLRRMSTLRPADSTPEAYPNKGLPSKTVSLIGAPIGEGQTLAGVDLAPDAFRQAGLQQIVEQRHMQFVDYGNVGSDFHGQSQSYSQGDSPVKNSWLIGQKVGELHQRAKTAAANRDFVLTIGGDHSIASGSITGVHAHNPDLAVIWVDAHGDCNTPESSESKNYHGMPLAHVLGWFKTAVPGFEWCDQHLSACGPLPESQVALVGIRDLDREERAFVKQSGLNVFTMSDIDCFGIGQVMEMALACVDHAGQRPLHLSFDVDACDPVVAPGTGTRARGGLSYREAHYICERVAETSRLVSMDLVEVNPALDGNQREILHGDDPSISGSPTVSLGIELISSALGKAIL
jgi:arginase